MLPSDRHHKSTGLHMCQKQSRNKTDSTNEFGGSKQGRAALGPDTLDDSWPNRAANQPQAIEVQYNIHRYRVDVGYSAHTAASNCRTRQLSQNIKVTQCCPSYSSSA